MKATALAKAGAALAAAAVTVVAVGSGPASAADASGWDGVYASQNAIKTNSGNGYMLMIGAETHAITGSAGRPTIDMLDADWAWLATPAAVTQAYAATMNDHAVVGQIPGLKDKSKAITVKRLANGNLQIVDCLGTVPKVTKANAKDMCLLVKVTQADLDKLK